MHKKNNFKVHVVKKRGRYGKVRQIHLFPMNQGGGGGGGRSNSNRERDSDEHRDTHSESETHSHVGYTSKKHEQEAADSTNVEKMIDVHEGHDNVGSESHHYEHKQKIKIKHHHHHHHHNHVKTVVKKEPYPVEKIVQVLSA